MEKESLLWPKFSGNSTFNQLLLTIITNEVDLIIIVRLGRHGLRESLQVKDEQEFDFTLPNTLCNSCNS
jgi:hypothetical protein